jgi:hypothetical protein
MIHLRQVDVLCNKCFDSVHGELHSLAHCKCGNVEIIDNVVLGGDFKVQHMQWADGCELIAEGTPAQCRQLGVNF